MSALLFKSDCTIGQSPSAGSLSGLRLLQFLGAHLQTDSMYLVMELLHGDLCTALADPDWGSILTWRERCTTG